MKEDIWQSVLGEIELSVSRGNFSTWFKNTELISIADGMAVVGVPNVFIKHQLEIKFKELVIDVFKKLDQPVSALTFEISGKQSSELEKKKSQNGDELFAAVNQTSGVSSSRPSLNEKYTFESFVVGSSNDLAFAACQAVVNNPGKKYNPLFVYGGSGLGKTHLIQAVGNEIRNRHLGTRVVYLSCETFVNEFLESIRSKSTRKFSEYYRSADVLIVDDIQFIASKTATQDEFFHTFNTLHQANKQIIISSDKPPKAIPTLEERLRSRFEWGMTIDIQAPDFETRYAILVTKAQNHGVELPHDVTEYLANLIQSNVRELEGALNQLLAFCEMRNLKPDLTITTNLINGSRVRPKHISPKQIIEHTARYYSISISDILGPKRDKEIVMPRQVAMYLLRSELHMSFPKISHELGRKDHTTAIHSVEKIEKTLAFDQTIRGVVQEIKDRVYA